MVNVHTGRVGRYITTRLPGQKYPGAYPNALALSGDGLTLYVANAAGDNVAIIDLRHGSKPRGFIPTEWYPTALALRPGELLVATAKGLGTSPNSVPLQPGQDPRTSHPYIATLLHGSLARIKTTGLFAHCPH